MMKPRERKGDSEAARPVLASPGCLITGLHHAQILMFRFDRRVILDGAIQHPDF
jgi:hypothetical protein